MTEIIIENMSENNITELIDLHVNIFREFSGVKLGRVYVKQLFRWFLSYPSAINIVAYYNNKIVGYIIGAPINYRKHMQLKLLPFVIFGIITHPFLLIDGQFLRDTSRQILELLKPRNKESVSYKEPVFSLVAIGVAESVRGKGVSDALIDNYCNIVREKGYKTMRLSVHVNNVRAINFYRRKNWEEVHNSSHRLMYFRKLL